MTAVLVDTAVFAYALGGEHQYREPCRLVMDRARRGELQFHASVEMVQELVFHRMRLGGRSAAVAQGRAARSACVMHAFDGEVLTRSLELIERTNVRGRDAVHAATALVTGLVAIISPDPAFDDIAGLRRLDPLELAD